jgi:hypothetical protein
MELPTDPCVQITYETFVEGIRAIAPPLAELQPHWERMPAPVKEAWRKAFAAGLKRYLEGGS